MSKAVILVGQSEKMKTGKQLLHAVLGGTVGSIDVELVRQWAKDLHDKIKSLAEGKDLSVCVLIDIRNLEAYTDSAVITILTDLMRDDSPFVYRTATFGGTVLHEMIQGVIRNLSGRTNLRNFKTKEEATAWLES